jgi:hypothetical protein
LRPLILADLPRFELRHLDSLADYTRALGHAHSLYVIAGRAEDHAVALGVRARALRKRLCHDGLALDAHGLLDARPLRRLRRSHKHAVVATELVALAHSFRAARPNIAARTGDRRPQRASA